MSEPIDISHVFDCHEWHVDGDCAHPIICDENHRVLLMVFHAGADSQQARQLHLDSSAAEERKP